MKAFIEGFENRYEIDSELLQIFDHKRNKWIIPYKDNIKGKSYNRLSLRTPEGKQKTFKMSRLIATYFVHNPDPENLIVVDHVDQNSLNDNPNNLEWKTYTGNNQNRIKSKKTSSKYMGVSWNKNNKNWLVQIQVNKKNIYLGSYTNELEAAKAYNIKAKELGYLHYNKNI